MLTNNAITDVFVRKVGTREDDLTPEQEREFLIRAKANPRDREAWEALLRSYARALRNAVSQAQTAYTDRADVDELRALALTGFVSAVRTIDPDRGRLAGIIVQHIGKSMFSGDDLGAGLNVPARMRNRYYAIKRAAGGDMREAERIAPEHDMSVEAFRAITAAVSVGALDAMLDGTDDAPGALETHMSPLGDREHSTAPVEARFEARLALDACTDDERDVALYAYGFMSYDEPLVDAEVAERLGTSRSRVQRLRGSGLDRMRVALGA